MSRLIGCRFRSATREPEAAGPADQVASTCGHTGFLLKAITARTEQKDGSRPQRT